MALYLKREVDFNNTDYRGSLTQLIHDGFKQVNVLETKKDVERGSHYHKHCVEAFYVISGSVKVTLWDEQEQEIVVFNKGDFFEIKPYIFHKMLFLEDSLMVQLYNEPVENADKSKDIFTEGWF